MTHEEVEVRFTRYLEAQRWSDAVGLLVQAYGNDVLRFLHGFLRDSDAAEEVFAQMSLRLCEEVPRFRGECTGKVWFFYKARYAALDWVRSPRRRRERRLETREMSRVHAMVEQVRTNTRPFMKTEVKDKFELLRAQLDAEERMLLVLYKYQEKSSQEVAEAMSSPEEVWTPAKVRKRWQRLKSKIAKMAKQQGLFTSK